MNGLNKDGREHEWINPLTLKSPLEIVVCIYDTFDYNFRIKSHFTKYLKESCWECSDEHFSINFFPKYAFACNISSELAVHFWFL